MLFLDTKGGPLLVQIVWRRHQNEPPNDVIFFEVETTIRGPPHHHQRGLFLLLVFLFGVRGWCLFVFVFNFFNFTSGGLAGAVVEYKFIVCGRICSGRGLVVTSPQLIANL